MRSLKKKYGKPIRFVGIDTQDSRKDGRSFVRKFGLDFPHLFDPKSKLALRLGVYGIPTMFLVDRRGRIAATLVGKQDGAQLDRYLLPARGRSLAPKRAVVHTCNAGLWNRGHSCLTAMLV